MAYKTKANIGRILNRTADINKCPKYVNSGVYQLHCQDFPLVYTRQTGRKFQVMVEECALTYKNNYSSSSYAQHLINHGHSLGHMADVMGEIFTTHNGRRLDMVKRYHIYIYIYQKAEKNMQINDTSAICTIHMTHTAALKTTTHPKTRCRKPYGATQHLMLLMMGVCTRNMSS